MKSKRAIPAQVQPVVRRFVHVVCFGDDTDFVEVRMNKKRPTSWVVSKIGICRKSTGLPLSECLRYVEIGLWKEINISV